MKIEIPFHRLKAMTRFASIDLTRMHINMVHLERVTSGVLLIATDGRHAGIFLVRGEFPEFAAFSIPTELILRADPKLLLPMDLDEEEEEEGYYSDATVSNPCEIEIKDDKFVQLRVMPWPFAVVGNYSRGTFPPWRQIIPADSPRAFDQMPFSAYLLESFNLAAEDLGSLTRQLVITAHGDHEEDRPRVYSIHYAGLEEFYGILMPLRDIKPAGIPGWLKTS